MFISSLALTHSLFLLGFRFLNVTSGSFYSVTEDCYKYKCSSKERPLTCPLPLSCIHDKIFGSSWDRSAKMALDNLELRVNGYFPQGETIKYGGCKFDDREPVLLLGWIFGHKFCSSWHVFCGKKDPCRRHNRAPVFAGKPPRPLHAARRAQIAGRESSLRPDERTMSQQLQLLLRNEKRKWNHWPARVTRLFLPPRREIAI